VFFDPVCGPVIIGAVGGILGPNVINAYVLSSSYPKGPVTLSITV
jgi:hypothetical protein